MGTATWIIIIILIGTLLLGAVNTLPLWREQPLETAPWVQTKRYSRDPWQYPKTRTVVEWDLELIFMPQVTAFQNWKMFYALTRQTEALASATCVGLEELNVQLQATLNMALQNRLTLDLLLLHKNGVCRYLNIANNTCCIHIENCNTRP